MLGIELDWIGATVRCEVKRLTHAADAGDGDLELLGHLVLSFWIVEELRERDGRVLRT